MERDALTNITLPWIKQRASGKLLYSTESLAPGSVITYGVGWRGMGWEGGSRGKRYMYANAKSLQSGPAL